MTNSSITILPTAGKLLIKPDSVADFISETDERGQKVYKASKDSKIVLTALKEKKEVGLSTGTVLAACPTAGLDFPSGIRHCEWNVGDKAVYFAANLSVLEYKGQRHYFLPSEFAIGKIEERE